MRLASTQSISRYSYLKTMIMYYKKILESLVITKIVKCVCRTSKKKKQSQKAVFLKLLLYFQKFK